MNGANDNRPRAFRKANPEDILKAYGHMSQNSTERKENKDYAADKARGRSTQAWQNWLNPDDYIPF